MAKSKKCPVGDLTDIPELSPNHFEALKAWSYLNNFRQVGGMSVSKISLTDIILYADLVEIINKQHLFYLSKQITLLDNYYLKHLGKKK